VLFPCVVRVPPARGLFEPTKKPQPEARVVDAFIGAAALPVGPSLDQRRNPSAAPIGLPHFKGRANSLTRKKRFKINREIRYAQILGGLRCCHFLHHVKNPAVSLCSAQK